MKDNPKLQMLLGTVTVISLLIVLACTGTQVNKETGQPLTAVEKASVVAKELKDQYAFLHRQVKNAVETGTPEQRAWLIENVTENMDKAKQALKTYTDAVILWREGGRLPEGLDEKEEAIRTVLQTILLTFIRR